MGDQQGLGQHVVSVLGLITDEQVMSTRIHQRSRLATAWQPPHVKQLTTFAAMGVDVEAAKAARDQTDVVQREQRDFRRMYQASRLDDMRCFFFHLFSSFHIFVIFCPCFSETILSMAGPWQYIYYFLLILSLDLLIYPTIVVGSYNPIASLIAAIYC